MNFKHKIALVICWYGKWPWYFRVFVHTVSYNPSVDFFIVTDEKIDIQLPDNIKIIKKSFDELRTLASEKLGFEVNIPRPYKLCDFKPSYGLLFDEYLQDYDFWGHTDIDIIFGNIRNFITEEVLENDFISVRSDFLTGFFALYKNTEKMKFLFKESKDYKTVFKSPLHYCFDECNHMHELIWFSDISILDFGMDFESMEFVVQRNKRNGEIKVLYDFFCIENIPGNLKWQEGILSFSNKYEVLFYHFFDFKKRKILVHKWGKIPNVFFIKKWSISSKNENLILSIYDYVLDICFISLNFIKINFRILIYFILWKNISSKKIKKKGIFAFKLKDYEGIYRKEGSSIFHIVEEIDNMLFFKQKDYYYVELYHIWFNTFINPYTKCIYKFRLKNDAIEITKPSILVSKKQMTNIRIVQTFWSKPAKFNDADNIRGRNNGGWLSEEYHAYSWALSNLKLRQFYDDVVLYTDKDGYDWLINKLGLKYKEVHCVLDCFNDYNPLLWALPKVWVYGQQNKPFIHVDGDVFIWKKFDEKLIMNPIIAQNFDSNFENTENYYKLSLNEIKEHFNYIPDILKEYFDQDKQIISINAGILGGQDYEFFKEYSCFAMEFIDKNKDCLEKIDIGRLNMIFEQLFCYLMAKQKEINIKPLFDYVSQNFTQVLCYFDVPLLSKYVHAVGFAKSNPSTYKEINARLKHEFPDEYKHIKNYYPKLNNSIENEKQKKEYFDFSDLPNTKIIFKKVLPQFSHFNKNEIAKYIKNLMQQDEEFEDLYLLADIYQIEKSYSELCIVKNMEETHEEIEQRLKIVYNNDINSFLKLKFTFNTKKFRLLYLNHDIDKSNITPEYLNEIVNNKIELQKIDSRFLCLNEIDENGKINYYFLENWDKLIHYFDENTITGNELIELINTDKTLFKYEGKGSLKNDIFEWLINSCFYLKSLKIYKN